LVERAWAAWLALPLRVLHQPRLQMQRKKKQQQPLPRWQQQPQQKQRRRRIVNPKAVVDVGVVAGVVMPILIHTITSGHKGKLTLTTTLITTTTSARVDSTSTSTAMDRAHTTTGARGVAIYTSSKLRTSMCGVTSSAMAATNTPFAVCATDALCARTSICVPHVRRKANTHATMR